jgi:hypothetical protein
MLDRSYRTASCVSKTHPAQQAHQRDDNNTENNTTENNNDTEDVETQSLRVPRLPEEALLVFFVDNDMVLRKLLDFQEVPNGETALRLTDPQSVNGDQRFDLIIDHGRMTDR